MKQTILNRIKALGGNIDKVKGQSLLEDLQSIHFDTVLYKRPQDTPWANAEDQEPIANIGNFFDENKELFLNDRQLFLDKLIDKYYQLTDERFGQMFWKVTPFTPFKEGTVDFEEWNSDFNDTEMTNLSDIAEHTQELKPDFIHMFENYGFPDNFYICMQDPNLENPTVFGSDFSVFFYEISNHGTLEDFFNHFMTKEELIEIINIQLDKKQI